MKHGGKRKGSGRKKKEPTKVVRVPINKPDFISTAKHRFAVIDDGNEVGNTQPYAIRLGFVKGAEYVWDTYINKLKTIHPMP